MNCLYDTKWKNKIRSTETKVKILSCFQTDYDIHYRNYTKYEDHTKNAANNRNESSTTNSKKIKAQN